MDDRLILSKLDNSRLAEVLRDSAGSLSGHVRTELVGKLRRATLVEPTQIPPCIVTMNSRILLVSNNWGRPREFYLVYPYDANYLSDKMSITSSIGVQLLGCREGATLNLSQGGANIALHILGLTYQPEAAKHWHR